MKTILLFMMFLSPLWPLGDNPVVGDPYVIINKQSNELAYIDNGQVVKVFDVATGKNEKLTPEGEFTITVKAADPFYRKKNIPGGDPKNPLGTRWIGFDAENSDGRTYGIHGTNNEDSIGTFVTQGCVRMYNEEVEILFEHLPIGTKVFITKNNNSFEEIAAQKGAMKKGDS